MKKPISLMLGVVLSLSTAVASASIITFTDSIKRGVAQHMTIDGNKFLLRNNQLGVYDTNAQRYNARLQDTASGTAWNLRLWLDDISETFAPGHTPRCPQTEPGCDTSGWLHYTEAPGPGNGSALTMRGGLVRYALDLGWGQYGYNAGGHLVTAQDGYAAGFWIKEWRYQTRAAVGDRWQTSFSGTGGDVNVYQSVSEPAVLGLLGLGALMLFRRRTVKR